MSGKMTSLVCVCGAALATVSIAWAASPGKSPASAPASEPAYAATADGLKKCMEDILAASKASDARLPAQVKALLLPQPEAWFKKVFGDALASKLLQEYQKEADEHFADEFAKVFAERIKREQTQVSVVEVKDADDKNATGAQRDAIQAMKAPVPLYTVRFVKAGESAGYTLWSFVYADGGWRLVGKMRAVK